MSEVAILIIAILLSDGTAYHTQREYTGYMARSTCLWEAKFLERQWAEREDVAHFMASCPIGYDSNGENWTM